MPRKSIPSAAQPRSQLNGCADREYRQESRDRHHRGKQGVHHLDAGTDHGVREQMVYADWHGEHEEECERDPGHGVAVQPTADGPRNDSVISDIGGHEPEVDNGV